MRRLDTSGDIQRARSIRTETNASPNMLAAAHRSSALHRGARPAHWYVRIDIPERNARPPPASRGLDGPVTAGTGRVVAEPWKLPAGIIAGGQGDEAAIGGKDGVVSSLAGAQDRISSPPPQSQRRFRPTPHARHASRILHCPQTAEVAGDDGFR
jgi:hypothetical protein